MLANRPEDLRRVRLPGLDKPFEQLTISELVQLRPGSQVADSYEVNAVTDNASVTTSSALEELGRIHKIKNMQQVVNQARLSNLRNEVAGIGGVRRFSAQQSPEEVSMTPAEDSIFKAGDSDPFDAS